MKIGFPQKCRDFTYKDLKNSVCAVALNLYDHFNLIFTIGENVIFGVKNVIVWFSRIFPC